MNTYIFGMRVEMVRENYYNFFCRYGYKVPSI